MDGPRDYRTKSDRERIQYGITYMWNLKRKHDTNELVYKAETDSQTQRMNLMVTRGEMWGQGMVKELRVDSKVLHHLYTYNLYSIIYQLYINKKME